MNDYRSVFSVPLKVHFLHANYDLAADFAACALKQSNFMNKLETYFDGRKRKHFKTHDFWVNSFLTFLVQCARFETLNDFRMIQSAIIQDFSRFQTVNCFRTWLVFWSPADRLKLSSSDEMQLSKLNCF